MQPELLLALYTALYPHVTVVKQTSAEDAGHTPSYLNRSPALFRRPPPAISSLSL